MSTEEPAYVVSVSERDFEVRDYPTLIVARVDVAGSRNQASTAGFKLLAGYIFGGNTRRQRIAMTAPVTQAHASHDTIAMTAPVIQTGKSDSWSVSFVMPGKFTLETLPIPNDKRVQLLPIPPTRVAAWRFSGLAEPVEIDRKTALLEQAIERHHLRAIGPASLARYNPPWTPWFMRRNEIWIPVQA